MEADDELLTLAQAAELLSRQPQRVNQMLAAGELEGPDFAGKRAPKGAGRVWRSSITQVLERRLAASSGRTGAPADIAQLVARERAARAVAHTMKVAADAALEELAEARQRVLALEAEGARLRERISSLEADLAVFKTARDAYSNALTNLLILDGDEA